ncbi:MAG: GNAT family N-acetyltransferase [Nitratireductor sp.]
MAETFAQSRARSLGFRRAEAPDAGFVAGMIDLSNAGADTDREQAIANVLAEGSDVGFANSIIADLDGEAVAAMVLNHAGTLPEKVEHCLPDHQPYVRLRLQVPSSLYLRNIATIPDCRGMGVGRALLKLACTISLQSGADGLSAIVHRRNFEMQGLLSALGFRLVANDYLASHGTLGKVWKSASGFGIKPPESQEPEMGRSNCLRDTSC